MFASLHDDYYDSFGGEELLMAPSVPPPRPRPGRRRVRVRSSAEACKIISAQAFVPMSEWENLPQDVLLSVVAQLHQRHIVPAAATCKQWLRQLAGLRHQAKLSQLPLSTLAIDAARRKSP